MTKDTNSKRPTHGIYQVLGEGEKARWNKVGAAWLHKDTKGANLKFDAFPLTGRIVLREMTEQDATPEGETGAGEGAQS